MAEELQQIAEAYLHSRSWKSPSGQIEESNVFSNDVTTMEDRVPNIKSDEQAGKEKPLPPVRPTQPVPTASDPSAGPKAVPGKRGSREPFPLFFIFLSLFLVIVIAVPNLMAPSAQELAEKARQDSVVQVEAEKVRIAEEDQMIVRNVNYKTFKVNGVTFEMAYIKGGTFLMGSNDGEDNEKPVQRMTVNDFFMGKTEVTQALWNAVMGDNHSNLKGDSLPVNYIIWDEAQKFIRKLSLLTGRTFRLPTEAEWEYAAGGGLFIPTKWAGTNSENELKRFAWYGSNSDSKTHKVATKSPNGVGLYDMTGNVEEWCSDLCGDYSHSRQKRNSQGYSLGSGLVRGGDWGTSLPYWCRISVRKCYPHFPQVQFGNLGLRVVYTPYFNEYLNK